MINPELAEAFERSNEAQELRQGHREAEAWDKLPDNSEEITGLRSKFNIPDVDSRNTGEFRDLEESQWKYYAGRIQNGDERLKERLLDACLHKMLNLAKTYPEQNGLGVEDYFMAAYSGYLNAMAEGYPTADKVTYLSSLNRCAHKTITDLIGGSASLSGSMTPHVLGTKKADEFIDPTQVIEINDEIAAIPDPSIDTYEQVAFDMLGEELEPMLAVLEPRDLKVVKMRKGIHPEETSTLDEVAREIGVTRERVRQIERKIFKLLARQSIVQQVIALDERLYKYYNGYEGHYTSGQKKAFEERQIKIVEGIISVFFDGES